MSVILFVKALWTIDFVMVDLLRVISDMMLFFFFFLNDTPTPEFSPFPQPAALPILLTPTRDVNDPAAFWPQAGPETRTDQLGVGRFRAAIAAATSRDGAVSASPIDYNRLVHVH